MSFFSCAVFFSVLLVNVLRGSDDVALALRGSDESAYLQAVLRDIGLDGDARARAVFLQNLQSPDTTYIDNRIGVYFKTRQLDPAYTVPLMRAQALLQLRQKTSHANKTKNDDALCRQAVYYGVVPALDAVSRYYGDAGNAASSFAVMKKAHFWRTFGSFCGVRQGIGDSSGTHEQALDTLIKLAPHVVSENSDRVYRATIRPVVSELAKKAYAGDMNACLRLFNLSGMSGIKVQECVVNAMKCVFEAHVDDAACLQFISAHDLEKTLQITAQCGDKRACGLLGRLFFGQKRYGDAVTEFGRANPPRLSDLYTLGKTARLCRLFSSVSAPLADDVCSLTKWVRANMSEDCLPCICKLFAPCPSFDGVAMLKDAASRSVAFVEDAHFLLGCACVAQKADLKEACEHFVVAGAGGNDEAKWCAVRCAFDHNIEECDERIFDWCVQFIKAEKSYFKDAARTLLCRMGQQKNEKAMARLLLLSVKNDPENQFEKLWRGLSRETAGCKEIVSLMTRPEEKKALRQYAQHKDTKVRARAKYLLGYAGFFESCLEPLQQAERVITMPDERVTALLKAGEQALGEIKWAVGQHIGSPEDLATVALGLGDLYFRTGHIDDAARLLTVSLKHREDESVRLLWAKSVAHSTQPAKDDLERAVKLIEKSANAGEPDSQALCGEFLLKGIHGFKKDPARAYELLSSYAQSFPDCPVGAFNLLNLLMEYGGQGRGTGYDYEQMYRLAKTAARNKDYDQPGVQMAGAVAALKIGKVAEAEEVFAKFPDAISVKLCRGVHLIESSQRETGQQQAEMVKQAVASFEDMFVRFLGCVTNELYFHFCFSHDSVQQIRQACMKHPDYGHDPALQAIPEFLDSLPTPEHGSCYTPLLGAFERAAAGGYAHAHLLLARAYQTGQIVPVDKEKACAHLEAYLNACTSGAVPMTEQVFAQLRIIAKGDDELAVRGGYYLAEKLFASQQEGEQPSTDEASLFALAAARVLTTLDRAAQQRMLNRLDQSNMYPLIKALALSGHVQAGQAFATMAMVQVKIVGPTHENVAEALDGLQRAYIGGTLDVKTLVDASIAIGNACLERLPEAVSVCIEKMSAARPTVIPARFLQALYDLRHAKDATHGREFYIKRGLAALHELTDVQKYVPACTMLGALYAPDFKVMSYEQAWERATHNREKSLGYLQWSVHKGDAKAADLLACLNVGSGRRYLEAKSKKMLQDLKSKGVAPHILLQCQAQQLVAKGKLEAGVACFQKVIDDASLPPIVRVGAAVQAALFSVAPEGEPNHVLACKMLLKALELGVVINGKLTGTEGESFKCALTVLSTAAANNVGLARVVALIKARLAALNCTDCE